MIDQRVTEGIKINFFGDLASTTTIPAQIIKNIINLVPIYIERKTLSTYYNKFKKSDEEISIHLKF